MDPKVMQICFKSLSFSFQAVFPVFSVSCRATVSGSETKSRFKGKTKQENCFGLQKIGQRKQLQVARTTKSEIRLVSASNLQLNGYNTTYKQKI